MRDWSPANYLAFADERRRPALDLLSAVPLGEARVIFDLGCGPGNSTELLVKAYPDAKIIGLDSSPAMIDAAKAKISGATFVQADLATWHPPADADLLFSNATFQWLPEHAHIMLRLLKALKPGGVLAVQMPDNLDEPSHALMRKVASDGGWSGKLASASTAREAILSPGEYHRLLLPHASAVNVWRTSYHHPLPAAAGIVSFLASTGLRPFLDPLSEDERATFLAAYEDELRAAYPEDALGQALLAFPRIFIVAVR